MVMVIVAVGCQVYGRVFPERACMTQYAYRTMVGEKAAYNQNPQSQQTCFVTRELTTQSHSYCSVQEMQRTDGVHIDDDKELYRLLLTLSEVKERLP